MILIICAATFLFGVPQQPDPSPQSGPVRHSQGTPEELEQAQQKYEPIRQAAIHLNDLAGNIHSEADARAFVDAVGERLAGQELPSWATKSIRQRVAHSEYEAVADSSRLIPEQNIVNVWNEYVRELDAPEEALVTVAEVHNMRDGMFTSSQHLWKKQGGMQSFWTIPNIYAVDADGKVASGCRAVESLRILHDMFYRFQNLRLARERVQKGVLVSDLTRQHEKDGNARPPVTRAQLNVLQQQNPVKPAVIRYLQAHGEPDYMGLLERLFAELFPAE
jgi:hypothetical protein